jgi:hypothetical protein
MHRKIHDGSSGPRKSRGLFGKGLTANAVFLLVFPLAGSARTEQTLHVTTPQAPHVYDLQHSTIHHDKSWYCAHPRMVTFKYFGGGEIVVGHNHAPCTYHEDTDAGRSLKLWGSWHDRRTGYYTRSRVLLQRSLDGGRTWLEENDVIVYDEGISSVEKRNFLYHQDGPREPYDMFRPEAVFFFGQAYLPKVRDIIPVCFVLRSPDKGETWEKVPTIIKHPDGDKNPNGDYIFVFRNCYPVVRMPDKRTLLAVVVDVKPGGGPMVYSSRDQGVTWSFLSHVAVDRPSPGRFTYEGLMLLPRGELQCYYLHISSEDQNVQGSKNAICMSVSKDGGKHWSQSVPIVGDGRECWKNPGSQGVDYRSPWPIRLKDGRILVVFGRRRMPMGIGGVLSSDGGKTWSKEFVIRDDASSGDIGYPVGAQLDDGRIFTAYYYTLPDGNKFDGTRFIASSSFRLR